ncbi:alpha/beta hydrolase [Rhodococcus sp. SORGH_AS_0301]|uniref:alpha/beta hydrolase n=1 Tax=Rhodococcus sp. SORGH_AS_0301 TaxID=3041780 RepID=UPI00277D2F68|nr:alpha/beta fold hydrolase [Rhodococcus sp. SORGH_AS_0301]MDQ1181856.1 pimeloyl-ACP methyl ester carboxylesterase [Rhodococcus sp. SORGH_AS_0301]
MTRNDIRFPSGDGQCAAWLYTPTHDRESTGGGRPVIVMGHGLGGIKEMGLDAFARRFVAVGYLCLVFDYRHFGDSSGEPRQLLDIGTQLSDWAAAIAHARSLDAVDPDRVVVWGTSFGGGHAVIAAARDSRVAAAISQCPFTDGLASARAIPLPTAARVTGRAVRDAIGAKLGRPPVMIDTYGPPGSTSLMSSPDSVAGITALIPPGVELRRDVAARFGLDIVRHFPGRRARAVRCPIFYAICERDSVAPPTPTQRYAARSPRAEIKMYDAGHFDIYVGADFERNIADQLDFLGRHVPVDEVSSPPLTSGTESTGQRS